MNIGSITNSIASNFKFKTKKKTTEALNNNVSANLTPNNAHKELTQNTAEFNSADYHYLPAGTENNNWDENSDLLAYFNASKNPANKGVYIDTYA